MEKFDCFQSSAYTEDCKDFLDLMREISKEYETPSNGHLFQSINFAYDSRIQQFTNHVAQSAWNVLNSQGYYMDIFETKLNELWLQIYEKNQGMNQHVHSGYSQMTGFYFIEVPEDCGRIILIDPRSGKKQISLPERDVQELTYASEMVNFRPHAGMLFMTNSWIPHAISENRANTYMKVIHFNVTVKDFVPPPPPAEVI